MLHGEKVALRARLTSDIPILESGLYADVATWSRSDSRPWRPIPPGSADSPFQPSTLDTDVVDRFSAVDLAGGELIGDAVLWGIDQHNRAAHIGLSILSQFRGKGLGIDVVRVLCRYGFVTRGLHRLQAETLADNKAMISTAVRAGFVKEGTLRQSGWVNGEFADVVVFGLLARDWRQDGGA
jgi:RimJ/RimL family protein N-acetyltransferase